MIADVIGELTTLEPGAPDRRRWTFIGDTSCTGTSSTGRIEMEQYPGLKFVENKNSKIRCEKGS